LARSAKPASNFRLGPGLDSLDLADKPSNPKNRAADLLDGPADEPLPSGDQKSVIASAQGAPTGTPPEHPKIYDASEGTPLDPLRQKGWDLNSAKTISGPAEPQRR
jgi:UPF0755 protein